MSVVFTAHREPDSDGVGWSFRRIENLSLEIVARYDRALWRYMTTYADTVNALIDSIGVPERNGRTTYDALARRDPLVKAAWAFLDLARTNLEAHIHDKAGDDWNMTPLSECDIVLSYDFTRLYAPMIHAAGRIHDLFQSGYTSIFYSR